MIRFALPALLAVLATAARATYPVGDVPPDFSCTDSQGGSFTLGEHLGKVVMVNFGATW